MGIRRGIRRPHITMGPHHIVMLATRGRAAQPSASPTPECGMAVPCKDMPSFRMESHALAGVEAVVANALASTQWLDATRNLCMAVELTARFIGSCEDRNPECLEYLKELIQLVRIYMDSVARTADPETSAQALRMVTDVACNEDFRINPMPMVELLSCCLSFAQLDDTRARHGPADAMVFRWHRRHHPQRHPHARRRHGRAMQGHAVVPHGIAGARRRGSGRGQRAREHPVARPADAMVFRWHRRHHPQRHPHARRRHGRAMQGHAVVPHGIAGARRRGSGRGQRAREHPVARRHAQPVHGGRTDRTVHRIVRGPQPGLPGIPQGSPPAPPPRPKAAWTCHARTCRRSAWNRRRSPAWKRSWPTRSRAPSGSTPRATCAWRSN